jgi:hypothetical protein
MELSPLQKDFRRLASRRPFQKRVDAILPGVKCSRAESSATGGADLLGHHFHTIPVIDRNGDELLVYEIIERRFFFGLIVKKRLALCAGERVEKLDDRTFVVVATGERLIRA